MNKPQFLLSYLIKTIKSIFLNSKFLPLSVRFHRHLYSFMTLKQSRDNEKINSFPHMWSKNNWAS